MVGVAADDALDDFGEALGIGEDVLLVVAGANEFDGRLELEAIFLERGIPNGVAGDDGGIGMESDASDAGGGAGELAEEIDESAFAGHGVLVGENADGAGVFEDFEHGAGGFIFEDGTIAGAAAVAIDEGVDAGIIDGARHVVQRESIEGVGVGGKLPGADMAGEVQDAFAAAVGFKEMLVAGEDDVVLDIFGSVAGEASEFGGHPGEIADHGALDGGALGIRQVRECDLEVDAGGFAELGRSEVEEPGEERGERARERTRKEAEEF